MESILEQIKKPNDIKQICPEDYKRLAFEIRRFLLEHVSKTGGHVASNLGVVELTIAIHLSLNFPEDNLIWDVGHQAYTHKILTGRKSEFDTLRCYGGLSGFPKTKESNCDSFNTGHSSTSISIALGLAKARELLGKKNRIVAVIGDGALSGGMAYEALNNAARLKSNLVIILNDNNMSINENVGGMARYLGEIRTNNKYIGLKDGIENYLKKFPKIGNSIIKKVRRSKDSIKRLFIPGMLFEDMGLTYIGPIDGHNIEHLKVALESAKKVERAVIVHVVTKKGKGYSKAEKNPAKFHGIDSFYLGTGEVIKKKQADSYTDIFAKTLIQLAKEQENIIAITAAMPSGTGLIKYKQQFPSRCFDVGIAEEHAVTFAAGLAKGGMKPFVAIYSTFLQRAYDQILHDVCINQVPVVLAIDRAGLVGNDGETHQGIYDISFLSTIPGLTLVAPKNKIELQQMLRFAAGFEAPLAIRYPRGEAFTGLEQFHQPIQYGKGEILYLEEEIALLAVGNMVKVGEEVRNLLKVQGKKVSFINMRFIRPFDKQLIDKLVKQHTMFVTLEENITTGGFGEAISSYLCQQQIKTVKQINISIPDQFVEHGDTSILKQKLGLDAKSIVQKIMEQ